MRRRGFTLIEILTTLLLLALIATIAGKIFHDSMREIGKQRLREWNDAARQSLIDHLRMDTWTSTAAQISNGELRLQTGARSVTYRVEEQHVRRLVAGEGDMLWEQHEKTEFAVSGGLITLQTPAQTFTFVAPVIGERGQP